MTIRSRPSTFREAVHIVAGVSAGGTLYQCGAKEFIFHQDPLCPGPCAVDPIRHVSLRERYWRDICDDRKSRKRRHMGPKPWMPFFGLREFAARLKLHSKRLPIIIWTAASLRDSLAFWWTLDAIERLGFDRTRLWIGEPQAPANCRNEIERRLVTFPSDWFRAAFDQLRPLNAATAKSGATLWRQFARSNPLAFDAARRNGRLSIPSLAISAERYGLYFPVAVSDTRMRLRLSALDQSLFETLSTTEWLRPADPFRRNSCLFHLWIADSDLIFLHRLGQWAAHSTQAHVLERREDRNNRNPFTGVSYRLSNHGARLRDEGLTSPEDAPSMFVGGCCLYSSKRTWVRRECGPNWWIEEL